MKTYRRVIRKDPTDGQMKPFVRITETRIKVKYISVERLHAKRVENQKMLDAQE